VSGHRHFTYELASGYRSPWLWPTAEAAREHGTGAQSGEEIFVLEVPADGDPVRVAGSHSEVSVGAREVKAWCGQRGSGDMMQRVATLRLDAGGVQVDIVGTAAELAQVRDRIVAACDRGLGSV
jgi:hypothetical protein